MAALEFSRRFGEIESSIDLGKVLSISTKTLKPQNCHGEIWEHYSIPAYDANRRPVFELADGIKSNKYVIDANCILFSKLNPSIRRIWMPACSSKQAVCSTEFIVYKPKNPVHKAFYYAAIGAPAFRDFLLAHVTGSTGSRQRTKPKATLTYPIPNPGLESVEDFCAFANPLYEQIKVNERNSAQLEELRDTLLPKLMTGEIDVSELDLKQLNSHLAKSLRQLGRHVSPQKTGQSALLRAAPRRWLSHHDPNRHRSPTYQKSQRAIPCVWAFLLGRNPLPPLPPDAAARRLHGARSGTGRAI